MKKKLFLLCPTSHLEKFITSKYGHDVFFLTALGAVFDFSKIRYLEEITDFINKESIDELYIVHDTSCGFMHQLLEKEKGFGTSAEQVLLDLMIDNYTSIMQQTSLKRKKQILASLNVQRQASEILTNAYLHQQIRTKKVTVKGLVTSRVEGEVMEVDVRPKQYC